jgi:hypothetical protein
MAVHLVTGDGRLLARNLAVIQGAGHLQLQLRKPVVKRPGLVSDLSVNFFGKTPGKTNSSEDRKDY